MSERERWIVYPLLLMALGLAMQPKLREVDARMGVVKCRQLICGEVVAQRAGVTQELDAMRAKAGNVAVQTFTAGSITAQRGGFGDVVCNQVDTRGLRVVNEFGVRQAQIVATKNGGMIELERYAVGGDEATRNRSVKTFVLTEHGAPVVLGTAHLHFAAGEKPQGQREATLNEGAE